MTTAATIRQADAVVRARKPSLNASARQIALAIGLLETGFGVDGSWLMDDGTPSYNWGGLVGSGTAGTLTHGDKTAEGAPTSYGFKAFLNMSDAFDAFYATWSHGDVKGMGHLEVPHDPTVLDAAARGDARGVARTMYAHGYYTGIKGSADDRIDAYARAIDGAASTVASALGETKAVSLSVPVGSTLANVASPRGAASLGVAAIGAGLAFLAGAPSAITALVGATSGGLGYWWMRKRGILA